MADHLSSLRYLKSGGGVAYFDYTRDAAARITKIRREGSLGIDYQYDALDRLTDETWLRGGLHQIYAFSYDYDLSHNRMRMRREHAAGVEQWDSSYYVYDVSDALTKRQVLDLSERHDILPLRSQRRAGQAIRQQQRHTSNTGANQLVTQVAPTGVSPWNFGYDAGLNRYTIDKGGTVSYYLWDGLNLLEERDSSGNLIARYSYGYSSIYGIGSCVEIYQQASEHKYTLVMDHRGTAYVLLDETGTEIGRRWYDAFGVLLGSAGTWPVDLGYQSNWLSFNIGGIDLCLSKYRIYVPGLGIFTQRDFLQEYINKYRCWSNNPVGQVDGDGLADAEIPRWELIPRWFTDLRPIFRAAPLGDVVSLPLLPVIATISIQNVQTEIGEIDNNVGIKVKAIAIGADATKPKNANIMIKEFLSSHKYGDLEDVPLAIVPSSMGTYSNVEIDHHGFKKTEMKKIIIAIFHSKDDARGGVMIKQLFMETQSQRVLSNSGFTIFIDISALRVKSGNKVCVSGTLNVQKFAAGADIAGKSAEEGSGSGEGAVEFTWVYKEGEENNSEPEYKKAK